MSTHNIWRYVWRNNKNYLLIILNYPPYLFHCQSSKTEQGRRKTYKIRLRSAFELRQSDQHIPWVLGTKFFPVDSKDMFRSHRYVR